MIAVLVIDRQEHAVPVANALLEGGVQAMELTLRTADALPALRNIRREVPEMIAGVGTVLSTNQVEDVAYAGAHFAVAPGTNRTVLASADTNNLPFAPGIATPSDLETAIEMGCREVKFFPAEPSGGLTYLNSMAAPYAHLNIRYIPLGGVNENNLANYLASPLVLAVGGSWLATREMINQEDWNGIRQRASTAVRIANQVRQQS